jgi:hypothetical protein
LARYWQENPRRLARVLEELEIWVNLFPERLEDEGGLEVGADRLESHHAAPRCLLSLHEKANGTTSLDGEAIQAWVEWELEAMRWRVPVEIFRTELEALVEKSGSCLRGNATGSCTRATGKGGDLGEAGRPCGAMATRGWRS